MQEFIDKIKKYFSKQKSFSKKHINPHKHWVIILSVFMVSVLLLIVFSLFLLYEIKNDKFFQGAKKETVNTNTINKTLFDRVTKDFDNKSQMTEGLKTNPPVLPDPSL